MREIMNHVSKNAFFIGLACIVAGFLLALSYRAGWKDGVSASQRALNRPYSPPTCEKVKSVLLGRTRQDIEESYGPFAEAWGGSFLYRWEAIDKEGHTTPVVAMKFDEEDKCVVVNFWN